MSRSPLPTLRGRVCPAAGPSQSCPCSLCPVSIRAAFLGRLGLDIPDSSAGHTRLNCLV